MKKLLYLAANWPEPRSSAAGARSLQLLSLFQEGDWQITMMCAAERREHSEELPAEITTLPLSLNDSKVDPVFKSLAPDLVIFDRFMLEEQYGWRIAAQCPQALRILDTIDLHCLRESRRLALKENRERQASDWFSDQALRELAAIYRCDLSLLISDAEFDILTREIFFPPELLCVLPFLLTREEQKQAGDNPGFHQRKDFISIGNFRHPPNADSVHFLNEKIWPQVHRRCPEARLLIYGADLPPKLKSLHRPEKGFHLPGRAEDALEVMRRARVCLSPLRFGAGLKGKLLDAMLTGTPSVTTPIGAEGMQGNFPWPGEVASEPEDLIEAACRLYQDPDSWQQAQARIPALLEGRFDCESWRTLFLERLEQLSNEPRNTLPHQLNGAILRHHHHRSTEYFSRWIEAKNK